MLLDAIHTAGLTLHIIAWNLKFEIPYYSMYRLPGLAFGFPVGDVYDAHF